MDFDVVILGTDINAYYMARCYHELYNRKVDMIGVKEMSFTSLSDIINLTLVPNLHDTKTFIRTLVNYAKKRTDVKKLILVGTNDHYVRLIVENREILSQYFLFNYPSLDIINKVLVKDKFYDNFKNSNLDLPKTFIYDCVNPEDIDEDFLYPLIVKPSNGVKYYDHPFENMSKVYKVKSKDELDDVIKRITDSGYDDKLVIQEFIPGDDSALFDSILYANTDGKVELISFAQIGLQEHTHTGVGNLTVLVNGYNEHGASDEVIEKLKETLEKMHYTGFAEFDMKYDYRDGKYKVFEINPRQARSSYYLCALGHNLIKYLVDDLIYNDRKEVTILKDEMVLSFVPKYVMLKYITNPKLKNKIKECLKNGKFCDPLNYKNDKNFKRKVYLTLRKVRYIQKYRKPTW